MNQVSSVLRRTQGGFAHWCPGCGEMHRIPDSWSFNGDLESPTFNPSVKIVGKQRINVDGKWIGEWVRDAGGNAIDRCCHYFLHDGDLKFCSDSTHDFRGKTVKLPLLPVEATEP